MLHHPFTNLCSIVYNQTRITVVTVGCTIFITIFIILGLLIIFQSLPVSHIIGPERCRVILILKRSSLAGAAWEISLSIAYVILISQRTCLFSKGISRSRLYVGFTPCLGRVGHHIHISICGRVLQFSCGSKVNLRNLGRSHATGFQQYSYASITLVLQLFQRGKENQIVRRCIDHFFVVTIIARLFSPMVPTTFVRLGAVQQCQFHFINTVLVSHRHAFNIKKCIIKLHQVIVGHSCVLSFCTQVGQLLCNIDISACQAPILAIVMAGIGDISTGIIDILFNLPRLFQGHGDTFPVIRLGCLVAIVSDLGQPIATDSCSPQIYITDGQVKLTTAVFIRSHFATLTIKWLYYPELTSRKAGGLYVPISAFKNSRIVICGIIGIIFCNRIRNTVQVYIVITDADRNSVIVLCYTPGTAVFAGVLFIRTPCLCIERCCQKGVFVTLCNTTPILLCTAIFIALCAPQQRRKSVVADRSRIDSLSFRLRIGR